MAEESESFATMPTEQAEPEASQSLQHEEEELVSKKGASSVWKFFGFKKTDNEQKTIVCKTCRGTVGATGGNTSNLSHHLKMTIRQKIRKVEGNYAGHLDTCMQRHGPDLYS